jgi:predicted PurR-regulated permease PerM
MASVISMLASPALFWLKKKGLSDFTATMVITLVACLIITGVVGLTALSLNTVIADLPQYQQDLNTRLGDIGAMLAPFGLSSLVSEPPKLDMGMLSSIGITSAMSIADAVMFLFFVGVLAFCPA